jgi:hypothetical protein
MKAKEVPINSKFRMPIGGKVYRRVAVLDGVSICYSGRYCNEAIFAVNDSGYVTAVNMHHEVVLIHESPSKPEISGAEIRGELEKLRKMYTPHIGELDESKRKLINDWDKDQKAIRAMCPHDQTTDACGYTFCDWCHECLNG